METNFNFKSQIATDRNQSERLLALGIKPETADMCYSFGSVVTQPFIPSDIFRCVMDTDVEHKRTLPAWSLPRLLELAQSNIEINIFLSRRCFWINKPHHDPHRADLKGQVYDGVIDYIEWLIKEGYFPKEFLV